jgi:hypothetical protein
MQQTLLKSTPKHVDTFKVGDRVTCKSIPARSMLLGVPKTLELATYPSLIGVELTIASFDGQFIICTRASGSYAPALVAEDLELVGVSV